MSKISDSEELPKFEETDTSSSPTPPRAHKKRVRFFVSACVILGSLIGAIAIGGIIYGLLFGLSKALDTGNTSLDSSMNNTSLDDTTPASFEYSNGPFDLGPDVVVIETTPTSSTGFK